MDLEIHKMKVLFVCSGRGKETPGSIVLNQAESLRIIGIEVDLFCIKKKGILGYLRSIFPLMNRIKNSNPDLIHAHYSYSGFIAGIASRKPVVVSLMGSEMRSSFIERLIIKGYYRVFWDTVIVKTAEMKNLLKLPKAVIIPNGVNMNRFYPIEKYVARLKIGHNSTHKRILFLADPHRMEKNYLLAERAVESFKEEAHLSVVYDIPNEMVPWHINAADVVLLTSKWEGSPNIVKEAMACNCSIVSVDVGDVRQNLSGLNCCYICESTPESIVKNLTKAIDCKKAINGRARILELGLDSISIAEKIRKLYTEKI